MNKPIVEPNALLLQVMAHDLLSPLTAVKWQLELLASTACDDRKRDEYLASVADSTALGITLTKHAHVAAGVLAGSYKANNEHGSLAQVLQTASKSLVLQYERHGLSLEIDIRDDAIDSEVDRELTSLLVWSIAKFFLTCAPAHTTVRISGGAHTSEEGKKQYRMTISATDIPDREGYVAQFVAHDAKDAYDQTHVFTLLIRTIAPLLHVDIIARSLDNALVVETTFPLTD